MQHDQAAAGVLEWHPWMLSGACSSAKRPPGSTGVLDDPAAVLQQLVDWVDDDLSQERFAMDVCDASSMSGIMCASAGWPLLELPPYLGSGLVLAAERTQHGGGGLGAVPHDCGHVAALGCGQLAGNSRAGSPVTTQHAATAAPPGGSSTQHMVAPDSGAAEQGVRSLAAGCSSSATGKSEAARAQGSVARSSSGAPATSVGAAKQRAKRARSGDAGTSDDDGEARGGSAARVPARRQVQKQQRISWSRHAAEMQQLEQQVRCVGASRCCLPARGVCCFAGWPSHCRVPRRHRSRA